MKRPLAGSAGGNKYDPLRCLRRLVHPLPLRSWQLGLLDREMLRQQDSSDPEFTIPRGQEKEELHRFLFRFPIRLRGNKASGYGFSPSFITIKHLCRLQAGHWARCKAYDPGSALCKLTDQEGEEVSTQDPDRQGKRVRNGLTGRQSVPHKPAAPYHGWTGLLGAGTSTSSPASGIQSRAGSKGRRARKHLQANAVWTVIAVWTSHGHSRMEHLSWVFKHGISTEWGGVKSMLQPEGAVLAETERPGRPGQVQVR